VSNARSGDLAVFEVAGRRELRRIPMRRADGAAGSERMVTIPGTDKGDPVPIGVVVLPGASRAYVANTNADTVSVVDLATSRVTGVLRAGKEPDGLAFSPVPSQPAR
jgi:YVTN family beta-propeller protein